MPYPPMPFCVILLVVTAAAATINSVGGADGECKTNGGGGSGDVTARKPCNFIHDDDLAQEFTHVETDDEDPEFANNSKGGHSNRKRRSTLPKDPLEQHFNFTDDKQYFFDLLDGTAPHDKNLFHRQVPDGYAETDRTKMMLFDVRWPWYPPFTYRGLNGRGHWQRIRISDLMKKRNRSFMMLEHACEHESSRKAEKECAALHYPKLPSCKSDDQSPMNIDTKRARDSSLKEFEYTNLMDSSGDPIPYPFILSVPWDGTDMLTLELLGTGPPPGVEKGSISGQKLFLERVHIHYGENATVGSEHTLDGHTYAMELQFIFTRRTDPNGLRTPSDLQYWDLLMQYYTAAGKPYRYKNVHIISLWVNVTDDESFQAGAHDWNDEWNRKASSAFDTLSKAARKFWSIHNTLQVPPTGSPDPTPFKYRGAISTSVEMLELGAFFPPRANDAKRKKWRDSIYYNYKGGITHPPCFGYVEWDIYDRPLYIPRTMWQNFLYIHSEFDDTKFIAGNYRLPRHVYVEELDSKRTSSWTTDQEATRKRVLEKMAKRDLRRSKPTGSGSENYDYYDESDSSGAASIIHFFPSIILSLFLGRIR